jgi:hypothetical protein
VTLVCNKLPGVIALGGLVFADDGFGELYEVDLAKVVAFFFGSCHDR